jgi:hypothetical protein
MDWIVPLYHGTWYNFSTTTNCVSNYFFILSFVEEQEEEEEEEESRDEPIYVRNPTPTNDVITYV